MVDPCLGGGIESSGLVNGGGGLMAGVEVVDKVGRGDPMNVGRKRKDPSVRVRKEKMQCETWRVLRCWQWGRKCGACIIKGV